LIQKPSILSSSSSVIDDNEQLAAIGSYCAITVAVDVTVTAATLLCLRTAPHGDPRDKMLLLLEQRASLFRSCIGY